MPPPNAMKPIVVFRQWGNNLRIGNTLAWVVQAYAWCLQHGVDFYFPSGPSILGRLLDPQSPLFRIPPAMLASGLGFDSDDVRGRAQFMDGVLVKLLDTAKEASQTLGTGPGLVSLLPSALGCITDTRGCDWNSQSLADFLRSHQACIVNEPFPFTVKMAIDPTLERQLLSPSAEVRSMIEKITRSDSIRVGIHIRQTDFKRWMGGLHYRDNEFYNRLIEDVLAILPPNAAVFVGHDGEFVAEDGLKTHPSLTVSDGSAAAAISDFVSVAMCDYLIGPLSTFTFQASRLGGIWAPKPRQLMHLKPDMQREGAVAAFRSRLSNRTP